MESSPAPHPAPRMAEKRSKILAGAREVFREAGFERASVDVIAARAGVSKATVYNHFADKKALFVAAVVEATDELRASLAACVERPGGDVERALRAMGEKIMTLWLAPPVAALYRQAIAEAARLPEIGRMVYEQGTKALQDAVAANLARWREAGALRIDDANAAAITFIALCHGDLVTRMRLGVLAYPVDAEVRESVKRAVRTFVRAHAP
jgi:TetR/AcrR family transcriptional repressor of mexJK operon